ncbi:FAD-binding protein [Umezawaea tangerina]|uniref:FAD/FMN-containing dehydrogenase n=1 Tax=Umezawaea tangerina TaxID=84725 RepID=A0A2T0T1J2_9PSEU|nr:FAD-binding protein [Umezawaea tangerina]PRY39535.1 FAD/FMN-containing dehydrogenase [Umezawaea tangerina]
MPGPVTAAEVDRVVGVAFDPLRHKWVFVADAAEGQVVPTPKLAGSLLMSGTVLDEHSGDMGNMVFGRPGAVLRPRGVEDVAAMVAFCAERGISVAARGAKHTVFGQGLVPDGLVVDMTSLRAVHTIGEGVADVDAGLLWHDLVVEAAGRGVRFPALTHFLGLTVGGTLSVGGISAAYRFGGQVELVREMQVVTGRGDVVWCSRERQPDLFRAALAGLGQVGIITRVRLEVVAMPDTVHTHELVFGAERMGDAFAVLRELMDRREADELFLWVWPPTGSGGPEFRVHVARFGDGTTGDRHLLRDLPEPDRHSRGEQDYLSFALTHDTMFEQVRRDGAWDRLKKPWFDVFVADEDVEDHLGALIRSMSPEDWSPGTGFVLAFPHEADGFTAPRLRVPKGTSRVWLCDALTTNSADTGSPATFSARALARNALWEQRFDVVSAPDTGADPDEGSFVYPIGAKEWTARAWRRHYGSTWPEVVAAKHRYDPRRILTPGPGMVFDADPSGPAAP